MVADQSDVYRLIDEVPEGQLASYGMIASLLPGFTARMVGRALGQLPAGSASPWHRILNSTGAIPPRSSAIDQRLRLEKEGISFRVNGKAIMREHIWDGPSSLWIESVGADPIFVMETVAGWRAK